MSGPTNLQPRLLYCPTCKKDEESAEPDPKCTTCGKSMLIVVKSALTGKRITGAT